MTRKSPVKWTNALQRYQQQQHTVTTTRNFIVRVHFEELPCSLFRVLVPFLVIFVAVERGISLSIAHNFFCSWTWNHVADSWIGSPRVCCCIDHIQGILLTRSPKLFVDYELQSWAMHDSDAYVTSTSTWTWPKWPAISQRSSQSLVMPSWFGIGFRILAGLSRPWRLLPGEAQLPKFLVACEPKRSRQRCWIPEEAMSTQPTCHVDYQMIHTLAWALRGWIDARLLYWTCLGATRM